MNKPLTVAERLGPLMPKLPPLVGKLGSAHDGEVLAAARAIGRQLQRHGLGWNDLGRALGGGRSVLADPERDRWAEMAEFCERWEGLLTEREAAFVANMARLLRLRGARLSAKQGAWLQGIFDRLAEGAS